MIQAHGGKFQEAETVILKALELSPVDPEIERIYGALHCSYLGQKNMLKPLKQATRPCSITPTRDI